MPALGRECVLPIGGLDAVCVLVGLNERLKEKQTREMVCETAGHYYKQHLLLLLGSSN